MNGDAGFFVVVAMRVDCESLLCAGSTLWRALYGTLSGDRERAILAGRDGWKDVWG